MRIGDGAPGPRSGRDGQSSGRGIELDPDAAGGPSPPRPILLAAGVLAVATIIGAGIVRRTGAGHVEPPHSAVVAARDLWFDDAPAGAVLVRTRTASGADSAVATLRSGEGMFVRGTLRALARERRLADAGPGAASETGGAAGGTSGGTPAIARAPFRLTRYADGRLTLDDPSTGAHLELRAFGPTNEAAFAGLLPAAATSGSAAGPR